RRSPAHDVQFLCESACVLRARFERRSATDNCAGQNPLASTFHPVGIVLEEPRRTGSGPAHTQAARIGLPEIRTRKTNAAVRPRHPAPACVNAGESPSARARLQPDVLAAWNTGSAIWR